MALTDAVSGLVGFTCEAVCWGIYVVLFLISMGLLLRRAKSGTTHPPILIAHVVLFCCCTTHFALRFNHLYTSLPAAGLEGFIAETPALLASDTLISVCDLIGEFILLYRCWIVWNRNYWIVLLPALSAIAGFSCIAEVVHLTATLNPTAAVPPPALIPLGTAGYALPLAANAMTTLLIVGKLWWILSSTSAHSGQSPIRSGYDSLRKVVGILIESGMLYLITQLIFVVLFSLGHPAEGILAFVSVQIYGIAPTLIIIRVALGLSTESTVQIVPTDIVGSSGWASNTVLDPRSLTLPRSQVRVTVAENAALGSASDSNAFEMKAYLGTSRTSLPGQDAA